MLRARYIRLSFSEEEYIKIVKLAKARHLPLATYIRQFLFIKLKDTEA